MTPAVAVCLSVFSNRRDVIQRRLALQNYTVNNPKGSFSEMHRQLMDKKANERRKKQLVDQKEGNQESPSALLRIVLQTNTAYTQWIHVSVMLLDGSVHLVRCGRPTLCHWLPLELGSVDYIVQCRKLLKTFLY